MCGVGIPCQIRWPKQSKHTAGPLGEANQYSKYISLLIVVIILFIDLFHPSLLLFFLPFPFSPCLISSFHLFLEDFIKLVYKMYLLCRE